MSESDMTFKERYDTWQIIKNAKQEVLTSPFDHVSTVTESKESAILRALLEAGWTPPKT